jgi:uncharacterized protein
MSSRLNIDAVWRHVLAAHPHDPHSIHGPDHWKRVEQNGIKLAEHSGADVDVVRLFALFHDSKRIHDGDDPGHGKRGAAYARELHGTLFRLKAKQLDTLLYACTWHTNVRHDPDPTIGTCWDADRLDLTRIGIRPDPDYLNTKFARDVAAANVNRRR